ncbi:hypothetical protein [Corynebacterium pseudodiphtheriticum]|uniref:hypothetical protein n=1 Tax=Corynebacterium pseudodiphtheriticum TaxID=37637 RepID=UPI00234E0286|nr:hypothetical protein [Corynebacterium pseudodiphtheriticum]MDC7089228.1 hypothetical protein [Corynebacterium pseudodiphtheriticum]
MFAITSEFWQQSLQTRGRDAVVVASGIEEVEGRLLKKLLSGIYSPRMDIHGVTLIGESQKEEWRIHANPTYAFFRKITRQPPGEVNFWELDQEFDANPEVLPNYWLRPENHLIFKRLPIWGKPRDFCKPSKFISNSEDLLVSFVDDNNNLVGQALFISVVPRCFLLAAMEFNFPSEGYLCSYLHYAAAIDSSWEFTASEIAFTEFGANQHNLARVWKVQRFAIPEHDRPYGPFGEFYAK